MANTTYTSRLNPQFQNAGVQDVSMNLKPVKAGMEMLIKQNENELKALRNIASDQAQIDFNRGAAKLTKQYDTDYQGLDKALLGLENDLYEQIKVKHPDMAEDLLRQYDNARIRAVEHARKTYNAKKDYELKANTGLMLDGLEAQAQTDAFLYLSEVSTKDPEQRKQANIQPFLEDLRQHNQLLYRTDMDGNPIYTPNQIESRKGLRGSMTDAMYEFINGSTQEQLENFYNTRFQSKQWLDDTGFSQTDKNKFATAIKARIKELKDDTEHKIKVRAVQDTADLINNRDNLVSIEQLKKSDYIPNSLIDDTVTRGNKIIENEWYDPNKESDPLGMLKLFSTLGELVSDTDDSPDATLKRIENASKIMEKVGNNAKELNLDTEKYREFMDAMQKSVVDNEFRKNIQPVIDFIKPESKKYSEFGDDLESLTTGKKMEKLIKTESVVGTTGKDKAERQAAIYVSQNLPYLVSRLMSGDWESAREYFNRMKYEKTKIENSYWISPDMIDYLEAKKQKGENPLLFHNGTVLGYNGISNDTALFSIKI